MHGRVGSVASGGGARECWATRVPWILENPHGSKMWFVPHLISIARRQTVHLRVADFCQYGKRWRKRTRFLCGGLDPLDTHRLQRMCRGRHTCSRTGKPHFHLSGSTPQGIPWTRVAQPYPAPLCHALAHALASACRARYYGF